VSELGIGFAPKGLHPCHPERSEGSRRGRDYLCTTSSTHRFFVTSFLRMTFEARLLGISKGACVIRVLDRHVGLTHQCYKG